MSDEDMFASQKDAAKTFENLEDSDVIPGTPANICKKKKFRKKKVKWENTLFVYKENNFKDGITMTNAGTFNYNKPYVYHELEEVLQYSLRCFPKNNNIHLIGVHKFNNCIGHFLEKHCDEQVTVSLDFTVARTIPNENEVISVFGSLDITNSLPVFVVNFVRKEVEIVVNRYVEILLHMRKYVPSDYISMINSTKIQ